MSDAWILPVTGHGATLNRSRRFGVKVITSTGDDASPDETFDTREAARMHIFNMRQRGGWHGARFFTVPR